MERRNDGLALTRCIMVEWRTGDYHPVVDLPDEYEVRDFPTGKYTPSNFEYDIGRYDELRPGM